MLAGSARPTILFVDEVHRFNKAQQDAFLPYVEQGLLTFIGATTENPSFEVNSALLSRAAVYVLQPLAAAELGTTLRSRGGESAARAPVSIPSRASASSASPTATRAGSSICSRSCRPRRRAPACSEIDGEFVENAVARSLRRFDKGGDAFYDQISALHKAVRGSNPDAALYWLVRMLDGGADPLYLARRLIRMATEDIGLADPRALTLDAGGCARPTSAWARPEGELALAQAVIYLACAPKSNAVYVAYNSARSFVAEDQSRPVPLHLRNAPTRLMKKLGYGREYRYAHDEADSYAAGERYFPEGCRR